MAYLNQEDRRSKITSVAAVAALEAAAVLAIISGLAVTYTKQPPAPPMPTTNYFPTKSPEQPEQPSARDNKDTTIQDPGLTTSTPQVPTGETTPLGQTEGSGGGTITVLEPPLPPKPEPTPLFTPKAATPRNAPSSWATPNDYPSRDLREGNHGRVRFTLSISANGKVTSCVVTESSGFIGLDNATCKLVGSRAKFNPAMDDSGAAVAGNYSSSITWRIPADN